MRNSIVTGLFLTVLLTQAPAFCQNASLQIDPPLIVGTAGQSVEIRVLLTSNEPAYAAQFTIDYNDAVAIYEDASLGADLPAGDFSTLVNPNPTAGINSPNTNRSVLVQVFGGAHSVTGSSIEIAVLRFTLASGVCDASPLSFDTSCAPHTHVAINDDAVCHPDLTLESGRIATDCASPVDASTWGAVKSLYRE